METKNIGRRDFIKYGLMSSLFILSGCSTSKTKLVFKGVANSFPDELIYSLPAAWEFVPISTIESKESPYKSTLQEKTDLLILNDGWISDLPYDSLREIKATNLRKKFSEQANTFLNGLGMDYKNKIFPIAASPWVILLRNEDSLALKNKNSWEVILSSTLTGQIVFPKSPYLLMSIAQKIGIFDDISKLKIQARTYDDRNALNWISTGKARAAILPFSNCVKSLTQDPRLSVLLPDEGSPLNWTVICSPKHSSETFPSESFDMLWGKKYLNRIILKGYLPPTNFFNIRTRNINISKKYQSIFLPEESFWRKCWSLPLLDFKDKKELANHWNNS